MYGHKNMYIYIFWFQSMKKCNRLNNGFIPDVFFYAKATGRLPIMEQELLTLSETLEFTPSYYGVCVAESLFFCVVFFQDWWQNLNKKKVQIFLSVNNMLFLLLLSKQMFLIYRLQLMMTDWWTLVGWSWLIYQIFHHYKPIISCLP